MNEWIMDGWMVNDGWMGGGGGLVPSRHPIQFALVELAEASFPPDFLQKPEE